MNKETIDFISASGLPEDAAPFLGFYGNDKDQTITKLTEKYNFLDAKLEKYIVIGSCSNGDPIAINTDMQDQVFLLDHEVKFKPWFFNSSILALATSLLAYRDFVLAINQNESNNFLDSDFTDLQFEDLKSRIYEADPLALNENCFWAEELRCLLAEREDYRNQEQNENQK